MADYLGTAAMKQTYAESLIDNGDTERALEVYQKKNTEPIYEGLSFHPEAEPIRQNINNALTEIAIDLKGLDAELIHSSEQYATLLNNMNTRLLAADEVLEKEAERIMDMNVICGNYDEFVRIQTIYPDQCSGSFGILNNNTYFASTSSSFISAMTVIDVAGNGYEGNRYVLASDDASFLRDSIDTSNRINITDASDFTVYEYSRLTTNDSVDGLPVEFNTDNEEARCSVTLYHKQPVNMIKVKSDEDLIIEDIRYSDDGKTFASALNNEIEINNPMRKYTDPNYAYSSDVITFPASSYIKIQMRSNGVTDENIGVLKNGSINLLSNTKRHVVNIKSISAIRGTYSQGTIIADNLVTAPINSIAVFSNESIPSGFSNDKTYIKYVLTVNGIDYDIVPINSDKKGTKVIRFSASQKSEDYVKYINESIKEAKLTVIIDTPDEASSPIMSNLKICYGKAAAR